jgi:DNA topoisomerase-1
MRKKKPQEVCLNKECPGKKQETNHPDIKKENGVETINKICPKCGKPLVLRRSIYGQFIGCTGYPKCRHTEKITSNNNNNIITPPSSES